MTHTTRNNRNIAVALLWLASFAVSCSGGSDTGKDGEDTQPHVSLSTRSAGDIINNMQVYIFNGQGPNQDHFVKQAFNLNRGVNTLKFPIEVGTWNLVLLSDESGPLSGIKPPSAGTSRGSLTLWETQPVAGILPDAEVIVFGEIIGQTILPNIDQTASCAMNRAAAMIKVVMKEGSGGDVNRSGHTVSLLDVPTTLSWSGKLMPNTADPYVSSAPMRKSLVLHDHPSLANRQISDTVVFIVPAHLGVSAADTLKKKINIQVNIMREGGSQWLSEVKEIPLVPKANTTLIVNLTCNASLEIKTDVIPWDVEVPYTALERFYEFFPVDNTGTGSTAVFRMDMFRDVTWSVTLADDTNFEFTEDSATGGARTVIPWNIKVKLKNGVSGAATTDLILKVTGYDDKRYSVRLQSNP